MNKSLANKVNNFKSQKVNMYNNDRLMFDINNQRQIVEGLKLRIKLNIKKGEPTAEVEAALELVKVELNRLEQEQMNIKCGIVRYRAY